MGNWLLDGTWSLGQVRHSEFRKKLKGENDHKVKKRWRTLKWLKQEQKVTTEAFTNDEVKHDSVTFMIRNVFTVFMNNFKTFQVQRMVYFILANSLIQIQPHLV